MRIGIFTDTYPPYINGVSTSVAMLENALTKMGHEVFIVTVNPEKYSFKENDHIIRIPGIPIGIYDYRLTGIYPLKAIKKIKAWDLDIIHSHTEFGVGTFARIIAKQLDIPLVHTYHTMYEDYVHYITKGYFNRSSKKLVEYLTKFYCDKTATELIVPTKKTYDLFKEKYHLEKDVHIVPTGIEIERFLKKDIDRAKVKKLRQNLGIQNDDFVILFVGRIGKEKSVDVLIDGQVLISRKYPRAKLVIVGDGPDIEQFKKRVKRLKLSDNVIFVGKVPWEEVPYYYNIADVFVTASKTETQGLTVIEAMAASLPVVAVLDDAFKNTIEDGVSGYLFKDRRDYQKKIMMLLENPDVLAKMSEEAFKRAEPHSTKYFAQNVLDVYMKALGDRGVKERSFTSRLKRVIKRGLKSD